MGNRPGLNGRVLSPPRCGQDKRAVERLSLEKVFHPFIAGAHNRLVQELSQETGARISIPPPSLPKDEIVITGEKEAVALALNRIRAIYEDKVLSITVSSGLQVTLFLPYFKQGPNCPVK